MSTDRDGALLWTPSEQFKQTARLTLYISWLKEHTGRSFANYEELWDWSVTDLEGFWASLWEYFGLQASRPYARVLPEATMPGARWFVGAELNYAEHVFRHMSATEPAVIFQSETQPLTMMSWQELHDGVAAMAAALRDLGVERGDRVVAYLPNIPATLVAFLACASIGAVWSSCSPDFGSPSVIDRFKQISPKVLLAIDGYSYNGKPFDRLENVAQLQKALPTLVKTIMVPYASASPSLEALQNVVMWDDLLARYAGSPLSFAQVPFDHPLWVLYSSGTTGLPKAIVQGHGGILMEHLKKLSLHMNLGPGDRFFWFSTTGWMMWNLLVGGLLVGATVLMYDGSAGYPNLGVLWEFAARAGATLFGTSAGFITSCMNAGIEPGRDYDLSRIVSVQSTGSPLSPEGFQWVYERVKRDLWLVSVSGGTDVCTAFVGGCPWLPVYAGEIQCRCLGARVEAFDPTGQPLLDEVGELVITQPMPSMPLYFWNDPENRRYRESYFAMYPGIWRHGDWIKITRRGSCIIYGRSDSTINRLGVRMGTSEIYRVVEAVPDVADSLVVDLEALGGASYMPLFVVLKEGVALDDALKETIRRALRRDVSPRHVPDEIFAIAEVPRTLNGKKLEVPIKKILLGQPPETAASADSMSNPASLEYFVRLAQSLNAG